MLQKCFEQFENRGIVFFCWPPPKENSQFIENGSLFELQCLNCIIFISFFTSARLYFILFFIIGNYFQSLYWCANTSHTIFLTLTKNFFFSPISYRILRTELQNIRRKGALRTCGSLDRPNIESNQSCSRCRIELGKVINRGATCRCCRLRVCKSCREFFNYSTDWVCIVCHKQMWVSWIVFFLCYKIELRYYINVKLFVSAFLNVSIFVAYYSTRLLSIIFEWYIKYNNTHILCKYLDFISCFFFLVFFI